MKWGEQPMRIILGEPPKMPMLDETFLSRQPQPPLDARDGDLWLKPVPVVKRDNVDRALEVAQYVVFVLLGIGTVLAAATR